MPMSAASRAKLDAYRTLKERIALDELRAQGCTCERPAIVIIGTEHDSRRPKFTSGHGDECALLKAAC